VYVEGRTPPQPICKGGTSNSLLLTAKVESYFQTKNIILNILEGREEENIAYIHR
jgi:hypothetical protein